MALKLDFVEPDRGLFVMWTVSAMQLLSYVGTFT